MSQSLEEALAQFHNCTIIPISVALACGDKNNTFTEWCTSGLQAASVPHFTQPNRRVATVRTNKPALFNNQRRMPSEPKHTHTWNPRQTESKLTCPQPEALHTKGFSSPIFAKTLQCNCEWEHENIFNVLSETRHRQATGSIPTQRRKGWVFKNNVKKHPS